MHNKIPYYMAYPEFFMYGTERTDRMDYDYMKSTYPDTAKRVLPLVEEECDRLEYSSSMIYDEYPVRPLCSIHEDPGVWLLDLIQVMLCQELLLRRRERREKRKFY